MAENSRINGEFYIDQAMNYLIQSGLKVHVFEVEAYASWGTPEDLKTYEYWHQYFSNHVFAGKTSKKISVVIPAYNEEKNLPDLIQRIRASVKKWKIEDDSEWIFVDNGSVDQTWNLIQVQTSAFSFLKPVRVLKNQGYGHGILEGLKQGSGKVLAWTHADCQTDPEDVLRALEIYERESKKESQILVKGRRRSRPFLDQFFSLTMQIWASFILKVPLSEINAQPKLFPRTLYEEMKNPPADFSLDLYLLYFARKKGYRFYEIPVSFNRRLHGEAKGGGGSFKTRLQLIVRTFNYISQLRHRIQSGEI